jgi:hypothetical protein
MLKKNLEKLDINEKDIGKRNLNQKNPKISKENPWLIEGSREP